MNPWALASRRDRRVQWNRTRRRWWSRLRNPKAICPASLIMRLVGFGAGVGVPGEEEAEDLGPPGIKGVCEPGGLGQLGGEDGLVEAEGLSAAVPVAGGEQHAEPFLDAPGGADLAGRVVGCECCGQPGQRPVAELVAGAQQQRSVRPGRVDGRWLRLDAVWGSLPRSDRTFTGPSAIPADGFTRTPRPFAIMCCLARCSCLAGPLDRHGTTVCGAYDTVCRSGCAFAARRLHRGRPRRRHHGPAMTRGGFFSSRSYPLLAGSLGSYPTAGSTP